MNYGGFIKLFKCLKIKDKEAWDALKYSHFWQELFLHSYQILLVHILRFEWFRFQQTFWETCIS